MFQVKKAGVSAKIPPHVYFFVSAIFHYLGPAFAVLLFSNVSVLGVAWFRIASAAVVFAAWRRPWRFFVGISWAQRRVLLALGIVLALMMAVLPVLIDWVPRCSSRSSRLLRFIHPTFSLVYKWYNYSQSAID